MKTSTTFGALPGIQRWMALLALLAAGCGGGGGAGGNNGPAIQAQNQSIAVAAVAQLSLGGTVTITATSSSGLPLVYYSSTPFICSVGRDTGIVTALTAGDCIIRVDQDGSATYAPVEQVLTIPVYVDPAQTITFAAAPTLNLYGITTVSASVASGLPITYSSLTPVICSVDATSGRVIDLSAGSCIVAADQPGNATYTPAPRATQTLVVAPGAGGTAAPAAPARLAASLGSAGDTVIVSIAEVDSGGSPITGFTVTSTPTGLSGSSSTPTITITCPVTCSGYAFAAAAYNGVGTGPESAAVDVITDLDIVETFREPATQPNDSIFTGTFTLNSTTGTVTNLTGFLTESMTGGCATLTGCQGSYGSVPMTLVPLQYQLASTPATLGGANGLLVTTFALNTTNTFYGGTWLPQDGVAVGGVYYGFPGALNPYRGGVGNAYAMIFVNAANPMAPLTQGQIDGLAYADCTAGGMMGAVCMTGTSVAGYGAAGTMGGYPVSQVITRH
jgi:hypothetical protein